MSNHQFQADRSAALRERLVRLPAALNQTRETHARKRRRLSLRIAAGTFAGATVLGALALAMTPEDKFDDASRIIESLNRPQQDTDRLPAGALPALGNTGIDPTQTRLLGRSSTITYYGAPAESNSTTEASSGPSICIVPVSAEGTSKTTGCTLLKNFEAYGLKIETPDRSEAGWLVVPAGAETSLESVKDEGGWSLQAPNFLVRNHK